MIKSMFFLILIVTSFFWNQQSIANVIGLGSQYNGPTSNHFDGHRFYNTNPMIQRGFFDILKWRLSSDRADWPEWINNPSFPPPPKTLNGLSYTFINHATVLIQTQGLNILTDPIFSDRCSPVSFAGPKRVRAPGLSFDHLPFIHVILISHNHYDHLDLPTLHQLWKRDHPVIIVGLGVDTLLNEKGFTHTKALDWWQDLQLTKTTDVTFVPARHFSGRGLFDRMKTLWGGFVIQTPQDTIYFAGDTGYDKHFLKIKQRFGPLSLSFLPIGAYKPRWVMKDVHLNPKEAYQAHLDLNSHHSVGIHFGTFDSLTDEAIDAPQQELQKAINAHQIQTHPFVVPEFGQTIRLR